MNTTYNAIADLRNTLGNDTNKKNTNNTFRTKRVNLQGMQNNIQPEVLLIVS